MPTIKSTDLPGKKVRVPKDALPVPAVAPAAPAAAAAPPVPPPAAKPAAPPAAPAARPPAPPRAAYVTLVKGLSYTSGRRTFYKGREVRMTPAEAEQFRGHESFQVELR